MTLLDPGRPGTRSQQPTRVRVARTAAELAELEPTWERLAPAHVDSDPVHFRTVVEHDPAASTPYVLCLDGARGPVLVVARLGVGPVGRHHTRWSAVTRLRSLVVTFDGVLGAGPEDLPAVRRALLDTLAAGVADVVVLQKLDVAGPLHAAFDGARSARVLRREPVPSWSTRLPGSWTELLAGRSSKSRRQIRYDDNRFERDHGARMTLRRLHEPEHAARVPADLLRIARRSYQRRLGVSIADSPVQQALLAMAADTGRLRAWAMYLDEEPVAFWWGMVHRGTLSIGSPGYVPEVGPTRAGYYTFKRMLEDACADPETTRLDYGPGAADYKERFGTDRVEVADLLVFATRPRALLVRAVAGAEARAITVAKDLVERSGRAREVRRWWRARRPSDASGG